MMFCIAHLLNRFVFKNSTFHLSTVTFNSLLRSNLFLYFNLIIPISFTVYGLSEYFLITFLSLNILHISLEDNPSLDILQTASSLLRFSSVKNGIVRAGVSITVNVFNNITFGSDCNLNLLHCHRFGQIAGLVNISTFCNTGVIGH